MNRAEAIQPDLKLVGSEKEKRQEELGRLSDNIFHFLKSRKSDDKETTINLLYNTFCELDEKFTGGVCTLEHNEENVKAEITEFLDKLPQNYNGRNEYDEKLIIKLCYDQMVVELVEKKNKNNKEPIMMFGLVGYNPEMSEVFVGNKIFKPEIK